MCPPDCSEEKLSEEQNCYAGCCGSKLKVNMWHWSIANNLIEIKEVEKVFQKVQTCMLFKKYYLYEAQKIWKKCYHFHKKKLDKGVWH